MSEFRFSRQSIENNSDSIAPWIQTFISTIKDLQGSEVESGEYEPEEAHCDCQLKMIYALLKLPFNMNAEDIDKTWGKAFDDMKDKKFTSIILEFLQNARDLEEPTTDLQIEIGDDQAILSHENPRWTYAQLSAAVQINLSSKQGDIGTIGEFGLGLKYWWKWYKEFALDITCDCQGTPWTHRLSFEGAFNGEKSVVSSRPNPGASIGTCFTFSKWKNTTKLADMPPGMSNFNSRIRRPSQRTATKISNSL